MYCPFSAITNRTRIDGVIIVELGISKFLSFEKRFVSIQALLRRKEYKKANYEKKVTLPAKKPLNAVCEEIAVFNV